jgi:predicted MFS family arabinose efflux permease
VFTAALGFAAPLLPLFYVRELGAPDAWIGVIGAAQSAGGVCGYLIARRISHRRSGFAVLLPSMLVASLAPAAMAALHSLPLVAGVALVAGIAIAGTQLALFDELMKRVPRAHGVTFSSVDQSLQNLALIVAPSLGGVLAVTIGVRAGLVAAALVALGGFALFALDWRSARRSASGPRGRGTPRGSATRPA